MKIFEMQEKAFKVQRQTNKGCSKNHIMKETLQSIEISFDIFETFLKIPFEKEEIVAIAIHEIVLRSHKILQAVTLNATAGIEIPAMALLRDLIEIEYLLRYFKINIDEVPEWWHADRKTRLKKYSPSKIREKITKEYPELKKPMEEDYWGHSEIAAHPTPISLKLQKEFKNDVLSPHSINPAFIWVVIAEISFHATRLSKLVVYFGDRIYPQLDFKTKGNKLEKMMSSLDVSKKTARCILHYKLDSIEKKYQTQSKK